MNPKQIYFRSSQAFRRILWLVLLAGLDQGIRAEVVIDSISIRSDGHVEIRFPLASDSYYILRSGPTTEIIASLTAFRLGGTGTGELIDPVLDSSRTHFFYQIQQ